MELVGIGPGPLCGMILADHGAEVIRVTRPEQSWGDWPDLGTRGKHNLAIDLKEPTGREMVLRLVSHSDGLLEGFRPGVMEKLGLGPQDCLAKNPKLVYGRMTGWGQSGPLAYTAGHDLNYIALSGALGAIGTSSPAIPLNLLGDYGGGGLLLAFGMLAGLLSARQNGKGVVVDAAMVEGAAMLMTPIYELLAHQLWTDERQSNLLDGAAPFYSVYPTSDHQFVAVASLEPKFYQELLSGLQIDPETLPDQYDRSGWDQIRAVFAHVFYQKTRAEWEQIFSGTDACVSPVLNMTEAREHQHLAQRNFFQNYEDSPIPGPAPRFSAPDINTIASPPVEPADSNTAGALTHSDSVNLASSTSFTLAGLLSEIGYSPEEQAQLQSDGVWSE